MTKQTKTTRPQAERAARKILDLVGNDSEALAIVMAAVKLIAKRRSAVSL